MARVFTRVRVAVDRGASRALQRDPRGGVARDLDRRGIRLRNRAVQLCPVNKQPGEGGGGLRASIEKKPVRVDSQGLVVEVGSPLDYAIHVHQGTDPHPISPKAKNVLWWGETMRTPRIEGEWRGAYSGQPVFVAPPWTQSYTVNHPGTRAQPFLRDALPAIR